METLRACPFRESPSAVLIRECLGGGHEPLPVLLRASPHAADEVDVVLERAPVLPHDPAEGLLERLAGVLVPNRLAQDIRHGRLHRHSSHTLRKFLKISYPCSVSSTSGWNCTPKSGRSLARIAWHVQYSLCARFTNPSGTAETSSLWLSHAVNRSGRPSNSTSRSVTTISAFPNSGNFEGAAFPPRCNAMNWCPAQMPNTGTSALSMSSPLRPMTSALIPTRGAPPESTRPSTGPSSGREVVFGTMAASTPMYLSTRYSRCVHWPPLSTTSTRIVETILVGA